ncbi:MAG: diguanylate cyclase [Microcoleaceae cyanobacterium]
MDTSKINKKKFNNYSKEQLVNYIEKLEKDLEAANENNNDLELLLETITDTATKVENEIHLQNKEMSIYIEQVKKVIEAAEAVENDTFEENCLDEVAIRVDPLGVLARVFQRMVHNLKTREKQLADYSHNLEKQVKKRTQELQIANQELELLVNKDGLTKVANRRYFDQHLEQEWQRLKREKKPLSLILFDVDFFKSYNDCYGHQAGDDCLVQVAQATTKAVRRSSDLVARYGGEEFAVILPNTNRLDAITVVQNIQYKIRTLSILHEKSEVNNFLSVSLGVASIIPTSESSPEQLIFLADKALYRAKKEGRDRHSI